MDVRSLHRSDNGNIRLSCNEIATVRVKGISDILIFPTIVLDCFIFVKKYVFWGHLLLFSVSFSNRCK